MNTYLYHGAMIRHGIQDLTSKLGKVAHEIFLEGMENDETEKIRREILDLRDKLIRYRMNGDEK